MKKHDGATKPAWIDHVDVTKYRSFTNENVAETDVCVLSTVLDAVNIGFRVVMVEDALCSSSDAGHDALMRSARTTLDASTTGTPSDSGYHRSQLSHPGRPITNAGTCPAYNPREKTK